MSRALVREADPTGRRAANMRFVRRATLNLQSPSPLTTNDRIRAGTTTVALTPGTRLGHYEIVAALGEGGMGRVYRARDPRLDREVAIKVISPELANDPASSRASSARR